MAGQKNGSTPLSNDFPHEINVNFISEGTHLEGKITLDQVSRVHGTITGEIHAVMGSTLILSETSVVEGNIHADTLWIDGFVRGNITAKTRVTVSSTGRVIGKISTKSLNLEFGSYFEGECEMEKLASPSSAPRSNLSMSAE